jgi:hypothetical protein
MSAAVSAASASTVIGLSVEDQARLARMVVVGQVTGVAGEDDPVQGIESAVSLLVTDVFKGDVRAGETVVFHTHGGEVDGVISEAVGEAAFRPGQKVLVFIEEVDGRLYNLGLSSGVWSVLEGRGGRVTFVRALTDGLEIFGDTPLETGPVSATEMANRVGYAVRHPGFDHALLREARR